MKPTFKIKFGGAVATELEGMGREIGPPKYSSVNSEHWTALAPYDPQLLTEAARALIEADTTARDLIMVPAAAKNMTTFETACYSDNLVQFQSRPWPLVESVADVLDCTNHLNAVAEMVAR